jgi:hypothetical protein
MEGSSTGYYAKQFQKPETTGQETSLETGAKINLLFAQLKTELNKCLEQLFRYFPPSQ